jgi:hypothetical protein
VRKGDHVVTKANKLLRDRRPILVGALVIASMIGFACRKGGGEGTNSRTLSWTVSSVQGPRQVRLVGQVDFCAGAEAPKVGHVQSRYSGRNVYIKFV